MSSFKITEIGKDVEYWAGFYGAKFYGERVYLEINTPDKLPSLNEYFGVRTIFTDLIVFRREQSLWKMSVQTSIQDWGRPISFKASKCLMLLMPITVNMIYSYLKPASMSKLTVLQIASNAI